MAFFIDGAGNVVEGPDDARTAAALGYAPATDDQVASAKANAAREAEFGSTGQQVIAGAEGLARGATFGVSDLALSGLGVTDAERMAARREVNPSAALAGELGGAVAPIIAGGPAAAFAKLTPAARAAAVAAGEAPGLLSAAANLAPTSLLSRGAAALGERAAAGLAARPVLQGAVQAGLSEAVEGAVYGVGQTITEAALGDEKMTAETLLSNVGLGALLGAGSGALLGAAGVAIPKAVRRARDAIERGEKAIVQTVEDALPKSAAMLSGVDEATAAKVVKGRADLITDPVENERLRRDVAETLQDQVDAFDSLDRIVATRLKPAEVDLLLEQVPVAQGEAALVEAQSRLRAAADRARADPLVGENIAAKMEALADNVEAAYRANAPLPAPTTAIGPQRQLKTADAYWSVDDLKRDLDSLSKFDATKSNEVLGAFRDVRREVKDILEDQQWWGEQAARQAKLNDAWNEAIIAKTQLLEQFGKSVRADNSGKERVIDPVKINTYMNAAADDRRRLRDEFIERFTASLKDLTDQAELSAANAPTEKFSRRLMDELALKSDDILSEAQRKAEITHLYKQMANTGITSSGPALIPGGARALGSTVGGAVLGGALAGPMGAAVGAGHALYRLAGDVPMGVAALTNFERIAQKSAKALEIAADAFVRGEKRVRRPVRSMTTAVLTKLLDEDTSYVELANNPEMLVQKVDEATRDIDGVAPVTATAIRNAAVSQIMYLASVAPVKPESWPLGAEWKPTPADLTKLRRSTEALNLSAAEVIDLAASNAITLDHVRALEAVKPAMLASIREQLLMSLSAMDGKRPPYAVRQSLSMLLGQDLDGSMATLATNQAAYASVPEAKPPAPRREGSGDRPSRYLTETQKASEP